MPKGKNRRISFSVTHDMKSIKVSFTPKLGTGNAEEMQKHVNTVIAGTELALKILFADYPMLRMPTQEEQDAKVYVFKDKEVDNRLYKSRAMIYEDFARAFQAMIDTLFPDVVFISNTFKYQQGLVTEMTPEEAKAHQEKIQKIVDAVVGVPKGDTDGDKNPV